MVLKYGVLLWLAMLLEINYKLRMHTVRIWATEIAMQ